MGSFRLASRPLLCLNYDSLLSLQPISLHHQILASPSLCKHMSQFLKKSVLYIPRCIGSLPLEKAEHYRRSRRDIAVYSLFFFQTHHLISLMNLSTSLTNQGMRHRNREVIVFSYFSPGLGEYESIQRAEWACSQLLERHRPSIIFITVNTLILIFPILIFVYIYLLPD